MVVVVVGWVRARHLSGQTQVVGEVISDGGLEGLPGRGVKGRG